MQTILIAAQKGGSGKTTLTRNLAVAAGEDGCSVLCLDLDPQGSLRSWWETRDADSPSMLDRDPQPDVFSTTLAAARTRFDLCLIDTPPAASEWLAAALAAAQTPRARITEEAARVLAQHGRVAPVNIAHRVAYAETGATGQGVTETSDKKAGDEITDLWHYVKGVLNA